MLQMECPNCAADLSIPPQSPIYTCEYCGTAIQVSVMTDDGATGTASGDLTEEQKKQYTIKDHYIIRCHYTPEQAKNLLVDWVQKIPGAPENFEAEANIHKLDLEFYPLWVGEIAAATNYVGIDDWPKFSKPAHDRPGWYEHVSYYKREESGRVVREYQVPIMALDVEKLPKYLRTYIVTTTGKEYFDITHVKKLGGTIIDSIYTREQAKELVKKNAYVRQTNEIMKEVRKITHREDDIDLRGLFYIHFPVYEVEFEYNGKPHDALIDGSSGRIIHVKVPVSREFRAKTLSAGAGLLAGGLVLLLAGILAGVPGLWFLGPGYGVTLIVVGMMFIGINLRRKASERQL